MRAILCTNYGKNYQFTQKEVPAATPSDQEVLIKIKAATVASGDVVRATMGGFLKAKNGILGQEFAGVVEAVGKKVTKFKVEDRVFGMVSTGAHAEYITVPDKAPLAVIPKHISFEEAASLPFGANAALYFLKELKKGDHLLVRGASGAVGTFAVQYGKSVGAEVTGVCSSKNLDLVQSIGADHVIDYTTTDFRTSGHTYDFIFNTVGHLPYQTVKSSLSPKGIYATTALNGGLVFQTFRSFLSQKNKVKCGITFITTRDIQTVRDLLEQRKIKGVIDRSYPLHQLTQAFHYVEQGHKTGSVLVLP
ncbi:NAD(P)-dependent alcohol dehydrogenase [Halobacillus fulvus]|nr:NAD(P)-dependent alcohol dehydrogenase [Halobacillus fulvus]